MQFDKQYSTEQGRIDSTRPGAGLNFSYPTEGGYIELWSTGGERVIFTNKEAGAMVAILIRKFPNLVLDALGNV